MAGTGPRVFIQVDTVESWWQCEKSQLIPLECQHPEVDKGREGGVVDGGEEVVMEVKNLQ